MSLDRSTSFGRGATRCAAAGTIYPPVAVCDCNDPTGQHAAVLSKLLFAEVAPKIESRETYQKEMDDAAEEEHTGINKGMRVVVEKGGQPIHIYALHLASERAGNEKDMQRVAQASLVRRDYLPLLNAGEDVIVTGDLNDRRGQPTLRRIRGAPTSTTSGRARLAE